MQETFDALGAAATSAASRDLKGALAVLLECRPLLLALCKAPNSTDTSDDEKSDSAESETNTGGGTRDVAPGSDAGGSNSGGSCSSRGILGIIRGLIKLDGVAAAAGTSLRAAGIDDQLGQRVDDALACDFNSSKDLVLPPSALLLILC